MANIELTLTPASPTGSLIFTIGTPGPQGIPGPQGPQGNPGQPGVVYADAPLSYDAGTQTISIDLSAYATESYVTSQGFITNSALTPYLTSATAASTYLAKSGGYITGDIQSSNGSGYRTWDGSTNTAVLIPSYLQLNNSSVGGYALTVEWNGITFQSGKQTVHYPGPSILNGYATESWVTSQLGSYLSLSGGVMTGSITSVGMTYDTEMSSDFFGVQLSSDHTKGTMVNFDGLDTYDGASHMKVSPAGITFPDSSVQTTAYTGGAGTVAWGSVTGTLSNQTDLQGALDAKYDASNPAGFLDQGTADGLYYSISNPSGFVDSSYVSGALTGYATESWVTGQVYATESFVTSQGYLAFDIYNRLTFGGGTNPDSIPLPGRFWFQSDKFRYSTSTSSLGNVIASEAWVTGQGYITSSALTPYLTTATAASTYQTISGMSSYATQSFVTSQGYITSSALAPYAQLSGATFTGKVNLATVAGSQTPTLNLGGTVDPNATNAVSGDFWISNATSPKVSYKVGSATYYCTTNNLTNTFSAPQVFDTTSNTLAAVRITQKGTFPALVVEDSTNPDTTAFVVDQNGSVGVGVDPSTFSPTNKVEIVGSIKATSITFNGTQQFKINGIQAHSGGADTHELLVSFNGSTYRMGMRFVSTP